MASQHLQIPDELKACMLEEQANLLRQSAQNLRVLTEGKADYHRVKKALQVIDLDTESLFKANKGTYFDVEPASVGEEADDSSDEELRAPRLPPRTWTKNR